MPITYEPIASTTLTSAQGTVTFSSIPSTYTDLVIVYTGTASASTTAGFQFNGDTASNYSNLFVGGDGSAAFSGKNSSTTFAYGFYPSTTRGVYTTNIFNYANTNTFKTSMTNHSNTSSYALTNINLWRSTTAINSVLITGNGVDFAIDSIFTIYGIKIVRYH